MRNGLFGFVGVSWFFLLAFGACAAETPQEACKAKNPNAECCSDADCGANSFCYIETQCGSPPFTSRPCHIRKGDLRCHERCSSSKATCTKADESCRSVYVLLGDAYTYLYGCFPKDADLSK